MAEDKQIGVILDGLGVTLGMDEGDLVSDAVVLLKVVDAEGRVQLGLAYSEGCDWIEQRGMVHAAIEIIQGGEVSTDD